MYCQSVEFYSILGYDMKAASICMIGDPPKIWILKQENKYIIPYYRNDIDDGAFDYKLYEKSLFKTNLSCKAINIYYVIVFDDRS